MSISPISEAVTDSATESPVQSQVIWFDDGNIIFQAEGTLVRVFRGIISRHSKVFEDMFKCATTSAGQVCAVDGCPIVLVQDKLEDLELLMTMMHDLTRAHAILKSPNNAEIISLLTTADKYQCDAILEMLTARLLSEFPRKLEDFLSMYTPHLIHDGDGDCPCDTLVCSSGNLIKIINFAEGSSTPELRRLLPVAYFLASGLLVSEILSGIQFSGGPAILLSRQSQEIVLSGQRSLQLDLITRATKIAQGRDCAHCYCSQDWMDRALERLGSSQTFWRASFIDIDQKSSWGYRDELSRTVCDDCKARVVPLYNSIHHEIWNRLPEFYGLLPWAE